MDRSDFILPLPLRFNCWKHHAGYIRMRLKELNSLEEFNFIVKELLSIGASQMDLYIGFLSAVEICSYIKTQLAGENIISLSSYSDWIHKEGKDFRLMDLRDGSKWALRIGNEDERYVHIHPGRYSVNSVRVKAAALKTAAAVLMWQKLNNIPEIDLGLINHVRKNFISAPPIKAVQDRGLMKIISLLRSAEN